MAVRKEKRKNDFRYVLDYYDQFGKRHYKALPKGTTRKEADAAEREILALIAKGVYIPSKKIPTFGKVCQDWLEYRKPKLRASSFTGYNSYIRNHFGVFADVKISAITTAMVESFITEKQTQGIPIKTLRYIIGLLNQVLNYAVRHGYIGSNPLSAAERPRGTSKHEGKVLTHDEIIRLLDAEKDQMYHCLFKLAVFSGARQGELLGLTWADVSFNEKQIRIERTFNNGAIYEPKNRTSRRKIDLGDDMMQTLREWRKANLTAELVFPDKKGEHLQSKKVLKRFRNALKTAGLPDDMRFHDLRHTFASLLLHQGENYKSVQTQLGHSTPIQTLNVYSHLMKDSNADVADRLEKAVFSSHG